ncbi:hypothetical protein IQ07DRAFT_668727 [Pyrenochaeta sp. DS3sAY3a]|nr:hypothetical protein IQ07DRAFT_668727 [Pyrenochaeta sp. DS3sAY3a]
MVQRGVLGNIEWNADKHEWTTKVGAALARLLILARTYEAPGKPSWFKKGVHWALGIRTPISASAAEWARVMQGLQRILQYHEIGNSVTNMSGGLDYSHYLIVARDTINELQNKKSETHKAIALISVAHTLLKFDSASNDTELGLQEDARVFLRDINRSHGGLIVEVELLFEVLQTNVFQDTSRLLTELSKPLTILLVLAAPVTEGALRLGKEQRVLEDALQSTRYGDSCEVKPLNAVRLEDLQRALQKYKPRILHFSGHGDTEGLVFEDDAGVSTPGDFKPLAKILGLTRKYDGLEAVVLNACNSAAQAQPIADAVGRVVAMQGPVLDDSAIAFTRSFYGALAEGKTFDFAFEWAKSGSDFTTSTGGANPVLVKGY